MTPDPSDRQVRAWATSSLHRWHGQIEGLRRRHAAVLDPLIPVGSSVALLDYPNHSNVGDSAIWLGELAYLRHRNVSLCYTSDLASHDPERMESALPPDGLILLHGGGNLGDVWPVHRRFFESVARSHPHRRMILLPQTLNFRTSSTARTTRSVFGRHPDITVIAKDEASRQWAVAHLDCPVMLAPDSAFWLTLRAPLQATRNVVVQARRDKESARGGTDTQDGLSLVDWLAPSGRDSLTVGALQSAGLRQLTRLFNHSPRRAHAPLSGMQRTLFTPVARWNLSRGIRLLGEGDVVVTDRLHGHILCVLLGIPHVLLADANGKIEQFWQTWTRNLVGVCWADDLAGARLRAASLLDDLHEGRDV